VVPPALAVEVLTSIEEVPAVGLDASYRARHRGPRDHQHAGRAHRCDAATNAGFFVWIRTGAPGDPAGVAVYDGRLVSEPTPVRPALVISNNARRYCDGASAGTARSADSDQPLPLDVLTRLPGLIRNCGGSARTTCQLEAPADVTCKDPDELIAFDSGVRGFDPSAPARGRRRSPRRGSQLFVLRRAVVRSPKAPHCPAIGNQVPLSPGSGEVGKRLEIRASLPTPAATTYASPSRTQSSAAA